MRVQEPILRNYLDETLLDSLESVSQLFDGLNQAPVYPLGTAARKRVTLAKESHHVSLS